MVGTQGYPLKPHLVNGWLLCKHIELSLIACQSIEAVSDLQMISGVGTFLSVGKTVMIDLKRQQRSG